MARLDYTRTGSWRLLSAPARLDFTRSGAWRILPPEAAEGFGAAGAEPFAAPGAFDTAALSGTLEVWDIDPAKWDEIAPLFQRS